MNASKLGNSRLSITSGKERTRGTSASNGSKSSSSASASSMAMATRWLVMPGPSARATSHTRAAASGDAPHEWMVVYQWLANIVGCSPSLAKWLFSLGAAMASRRSSSKQRRRSSGMPSANSWDMGGSCACVHAFSMLTRLQNALSSLMCSKSVPAMKPMPCTYPSLASNDVNALSTLKSARCPGPLRLAKYATLGNVRGRSRTISSTFLLASAALSNRHRRANVFGG
mmetsp:Transcript_1019/g.2829  ORF Transcript_1019/g.2829 Transcript_1019/m.2829 type:complete len:228 (+) Transcript_1019:165-848(+)